LLKYLINADESDFRLLTAWQIFGSSQLILDELFGSEDFNTCFLDSSG